MTENLLIFPLIIPMLTAIALLFALTLRPEARAIQRAVSTVGSFALLLVSLLLLAAVWANGILVVQIGSWPMPFGITLVADMFSAIMVLLGGIIGAAVQVYALASIDAERERLGFYPLFHVLLMGVCGAFLTGDLFNLYVWFEVMLMSSFVLMALGSGRGQTEGAIKYVTLNLLSSAIFLAAIGILYGVVGTLNMADLSVKFGLVDPNLGHLTGLVNVLAVLFMIAFGIKAAVFPLFFWLPDSYHAPPPATSAVFAGLLTKVGVYAMIRVFTLIFTLESTLLQNLLLWVAALTMITGVLGAVAQNEVRRILSFHIISQIGYMVMGLALFTPLALAGAVFYILHHVIVKTNLFLIGGLIERMGGTGDLKRLGGLYRTSPALAVLFLIPALSLAGLPPLSGFFAKLSLIQAGLEVNAYGIVAVALAVSLLTLYSMNKIWTLAFWQPSPITDAMPEPDALTQSQTGEEAATAPEISALSKSSLDLRQGINPDPQHAEERVEAITGTPRSVPMWGLWLGPIIALAAITLLIGLGAAVSFPLALRAGAELMDPSGYITAVFGSSQ